MLALRASLFYVFLIEVFALDYKDFFGVALNLDLGIRWVGMI